MQETITVKKERKNSRTRNSRAANGSNAPSIEGKDAHSHIWPAKLAETVGPASDKPQRAEGMNKKLCSRESIVVRGLEKDPLSADDKVLVDLKRETDLDEAFLGQMLNTGWGEWSQSCFGLCVS